MINTTNHFSEEVLTRFPGRFNVGVISIVTPPNVGEDVRYAEFGGDWGAILRLWFHDIDREYQNYVLFDEAMADQIIDWLLENQDELITVHVHCAAGISRSAAVAKFIATLYRLPFDERKGNLYNRHVYRVLLQRAFDRDLLTPDDLLARHTLESAAPPG